MKRSQCFVALVLGAGLTWALLWLLVGQAIALQPDPPTRFVATDGDDGYDCSSIEQRCRTVQRAIDVADDLDEIWVATGTYTDPAGTVADIDKTVTLLGGWNDGFTIRDPGIYPVVLDAERNGRVVFISNYTSPIIDGFTITGGNASNESKYEGLGGGICSGYANPTIQNNVITNNIAYTGTDHWGRGGGIFIFQATSARVRNNQVLSNTGSTTCHGLGGGMSLDESAGMVSGNEVRHNVGDRGGGGFYLYDCHGLTFDGNLVISNTATLSPTTSGTVGFGGAFYVEYSSQITWTNNVIAQNHAYNRAGGLFIYGYAPYSSTGSFVNNTIAHNHLAPGGEALWPAGDVTLTLSNNIIVSHSYGIYATGNAVVSATHTLFYDNSNDTGGGGSINSTDEITGSDPAFVNPAGWNYDLMLDSPAINAGVAVPWLQTDICGNLRHFGPAPDLGAYEIAAALSIHKTGPATAAPGELITYTLSVTNSGTYTASTVVITDVLPAGAHYVSGGMLMPGEVRWTIPSLAGGGASVQVQFVVTATETISNSAYGVTCAEGVSAQGAKDVVTIIGYPDLAIGKIGPASAVPGRPITYTLTVVNNGPAPATGLVITDGLPIGAGYVGGGTLMPGDVVSWTAASLAGNGASVQVQFAVTATETITNVVYGVTCAEDVSAVGSEPVVTTSLQRTVYLPLVVRNF